MVSTKEYFALVVLSKTNREMRYLRAEDAMI